MHEVEPRKLILTTTTQTLPAETGGTDITRFNALRHGVLSRYTVLPWENADTLCMKRILKQATIVELKNNPAELSKALTARTIDALSANRQRLTTLSTATPGTRLLLDDLFNVPHPGPLAVRT